MAYYQMITCNMLGMSFIYKTIINYYKINISPINPVSVHNLTNKEFPSFTLNSKSY